MHVDKDFTSLNTNSPVLHCITRLCGVPFFLTFTFGFAANRVFHGPFFKLRSSVNLVGLHPSQVCRVSVWLYFQTRFDSVLWLHVGHPLCSWRTLVDNGIGTASLHNLYFLHQRFWFTFHCPLFFEMLLTRLLYL